MQLKNVIDSPCGLRYVLDALELQSGYARRWLLDRPMMTDADAIEEAYAVLRRFADMLDRVDKVRLDTLCFKLRALKDIGTTIKNLSQRAVLDDIELFEIKHLALLAGEVSAWMRQHDMAEVVQIPDLEQVVGVLDPDGMRIATFYVYDAYSDELRQLRTLMRGNPDRQDELMLRAAEVEAAIRADLCEQLCPHAGALAWAQEALANVDVNLAKAMQMRQWRLCFPEVSPDRSTAYRGMFHPQVRQALADRRRQYQPVDIGFGNRPTLITGANMGGKTVVLKCLTLCQYLFQFGLGIPAGEAVIGLCDEVYFCIGDEQSIERGLSSFAAEMRGIDAVIRASRSGKRLLALIDEPARTTNPTEGAALVAALLQVLSDKPMSLVMTTHYDIDPANARCLRVKGIEDGQMDYTLVEVHDGEAPHEALNIARSLGIDPEWIARAHQLL